MIKCKQEHGWQDDQCEAFRRKYQALQSANEFDIRYTSQCASTISENTIYFKAPSRTSDWKACSLNSIKSIHHSPEYGTSHEYIFVSREYSDEVSKAGDSGALIYKISDVSTSGTAVLIPMAMIWGGIRGTKEKVVEPFNDVTFATPVDVLLEDIESEMGWEKGSVEFC